MINPMKPGDIVTTAYDEELTLFLNAGLSTIPCGELHPDSISIIIRMLRTKLDTGQLFDEALLLTSDGNLGWIETMYLKVI